MVGGLKPGDPQRIGPYRLVGRLGRGGMGHVYLGLSAGGRPVAVKVIRANRPRIPSSGCGSPARSPRSARLASGRRHLRRQRQRAIEQSVG